MRKLLLFLFVVAAALFAYSGYEENRVEAQPNALSEQSSLENPSAPGKSETAAKPVKAAAKKIAVHKKKRRSQDRAMKVASNSASASSALPSKEIVSSRQIQPKPSSVPLLPRGIGDAGPMKIDLKLVLGENRRDIEERETMKARTHQEIKQYRLLALQMDL